MAKKKLKVPKKIGGFKIPKQVRKSGAAKWALSTPLGRNILADVLVAAAGAAAAVISKHRPSGEQVAHGAEVASDTASATPDLVKTAVGAVGSTVAEVARQVLPRGGEKVKKADKTKLESRVEDDLDENRDWVNRH